MRRLSADQRRALKAIGRWWKSPSQELTLGGLAGTGKTTILAKVGRRLRLSGDEIQHCAPTGKAAQQLNHALPRGQTAVTCHQLLYQPSERHCSRCPTSSDDAEPCHDEGRAGCCGLRFRHSPSAHGAKLVVVDEASMVHEKIYRDLKALGVKLLFVGDHGQLPPVNGSLNLMADPDIKLEKIHRQSDRSEILGLATMARNGEPLPRHEEDDGSGVVVVPRSAIELEAMDPTETLLLCFTNKTRVRLNQSIRASQGRPDVGKPEVGDRVICLRNNWTMMIHNGMLGEITYIKRGRQHHYARIRLDDENRHYEGWVLAGQFGAERTAQGARGVDLWDYGYCLTAHKAQGSEADHVVVIKEPMDFKDRSFRRQWLYTAVTRAKERLTVVEWDQGSRGSRAPTTSS